MSNIPNLVSLERVLADIRDTTGLPDEIESALTAVTTLRREARSTRPDSLAAARADAVDALVKAATGGRDLPDDVADQVAVAVAAKASADTRRDLVNDAVRRAEDALTEVARSHATRIVTDRLRPVVKKALDSLPEIAAVVPVGLDDASAFRAPSEVQAAYRKLSAAAELVQRVLSIRGLMVSTGMEALHGPANVFAPSASYAGGLMVGLVTNSYDLEEVRGVWPGGPYSLTDKLILLQNAGAVFHLATAEEIAAQVAADQELRRRATLTTGSAPKRPRAATF